MLVEAQLAARSQHAVQFAQAGRDVLDGAQHPGRDGDIERGVAERQALGGRVDDLHRDRCDRRGQLGTLPEVRLRFDRDEIDHRTREVVAEADAGAGADLEDVARYAVEQPPAVRRSTEGVDVSPDRAERKRRAASGWRWSAAHGWQARTRYGPGV